MCVCMCVRFQLKQPRLIVESEPETHAAETTDRGVSDFGRTHGVSRTWTHLRPHRPSHYRYRYYHIALPIRLFPTTLTSNRGTRTRCPCSRPCGAVCLIGRRRLQLRSACACAVARGCGARGGRWQRKVVKHTILLRSLYGPILPPMWALYVPCRQLFRNPMLFFA